MRVVWSLGVAGLACAAVAGSARAETWIVTVGGRASVYAPYEGADHYVVAPSPTLNARPADRPYRFTPPDGGTTLTLIDNKYVSIGPMARFRYKRGTSGDLTGLNKIDWAAEPGGFVDLWPTEWLRLRGELRHGVAGHTGFVGDAGLDLIYTGAKFDASVGPRFGWGDASYMRKYFGVTPIEAQRSPFIKTVYTPDGGRRYTGWETAFAYHLTDRWRSTFDFGYHRLSKEATQSPIVRVAGSRGQLSASAGLSYSFGVGL